MTYDDLIKEIYTSRKEMAEWDRKFVLSVYRRVLAGKALSTKQAALIIDLMKKYSNLLVTDTRDEREVSYWLSNAEFAQEPYISTEMKNEVRYIGDGKLVFRGKYDSRVTSLFFTPWAIEGHAWFNGNYGVWIVEPHEDILDKLMEVISEVGFEHDDTVIKFITDCANAHEIPSRVDVGENIDVLSTDPLISRWVDFHGKRNV